MTTTPATTFAESDPFFQLLTDALRAGPGSPQWGEAVAKLRDGGVEGADEYGLILRAREDIELGRDYRKVAAGPEFTRKVLSAVEHEGKRSSGMPTATIVAVLAGLVILGVIITVIVIMSRGGTDARTTQQQAIERLDAINFASNVSSAQFRDVMPEGWRVVGDLPPQLRDGLRAGAHPGGDSLMAGGIVSAAPMPVDQPFAFDAELQLPEKNKGLDVQLFVSDVADSIKASGTINEAVVSIRDGQATIEAGGKSVSLPGTVSVPTTDGSTLKVSLRVDRDVLIADVGGRRLYAGQHGLPADKPRYIGVRFLSTGEKPESAVIRSITISRGPIASPPAGAH